MNYFLIFSSHFDRDKGLDFGRLSLNSLEPKIGTKSIWIASSSHVKGQNPEGFHNRNSYIPPQYRVRNLPYWRVKTSPVDLSQVPGVQGNFYQILPYEVTTDRGGKRGDFGIHLDAGFPGSHGCIVMSSDRFQDFESQMQSLNAREIPLFVQYS